MNNEDKATFEKDVASQIFSIENVMNNHNLICELKHKNSLKKDEYFEPFCDSDEVVKTYGIIVPNSRAIIGLTNDAVKQLSSVLSKINDYPEIVKVVFLRDMGVTLLKEDEVKTFSFSLESVSNLNERFRTREINKIKDDNGKVAFIEIRGNATSVLMDSQRLFELTEKMESNRIFVVPFSNQLVILAEYKYGCLLECAEDFADLVSIYHEFVYENDERRVADTIFLFDKETKRLTNINVEKVRMNVNDKIEETECERG